MIRLQGEAGAMQGTPDRPRREAEGKTLNRSWREAMSNPEPEH